MLKPQRWFAKLPEGGYAVYDHPYPDRAQSVSYAGDLSYYRATFTLTRCWGAKAPQK